MTSDLADDAAEIGFQVNAIEFAGFDQGADRGGAFASCIRSGKQPVLAAQGDAMDGALGGISLNEAKSTTLEECGAGTQVLLNAVLAHDATL